MGQNDPAGQGGEKTADVDEWVGGEARLHREKEASLRVRTSTVDCQSCAWLPASSPCGVLRRHVSCLVLEV